MPTAALCAAMARSADGSLRVRKTGRWPLFRLASNRARTPGALGNARLGVDPGPPARRARLQLSQSPTDRWGQARRAGGRDRLRRDVRRRSVRLRTDASRRPRRSCEAERSERGGWVAGRSRERRAAQDLRSRRGRPGASPQKPSAFHPDVPLLNGSIPSAAITLKGLPFEGSHALPRRCAASPAGRLRTRSLARTTSNWIPSW